MKNYDIIIIGGGIAGLNAAYQLSRRRGGNMRVLLLESLGHLGGRVYTYSSKTWNNAKLEAGAGRFHKGHTRLFSLIRELGLEEKVQSIGNARLRHISHGAEITKNVNSLIKRIIKRAQNIPTETLRSQNILTFARRRVILSEDEITQLIGFYGYYSELELMNAYDAIELMKTGTNPDREFFVMRGGLSQIVSEMERRVSLCENIRILKNKNVVNVWKASPGEIIINCQDGTEYSCHKCILALPKPALENFAIVQGGNAVFRRAIQSVVCAPLCRIYSYYDDSHNSWIKEQFGGSGGGKTTTNNMLRFIIPVGENIIMTSYTDNVFAEWWKRKYDSGGIASVNHEITWLLRETFGTRNIPVANKTRVFYWDCGVGYWRVGANSAEAAACVLDITDAVFICGENYSEKYQQWIEGALDTSERVLERI